MRIYVQIEIICQIVYELMKWFSIILNIQLKGCILTTERKH